MVLSLHVGIAVQSLSVLWLHLTALNQAAHELRLSSLMISSHCSVLGTHSVVIHLKPLDAHAILVASAAMLLAPVS